MRIAFCLSGLSYSNNDKHIDTKTKKGDIVDYTIGYEYFKKNIFDINDNIDVFIHSWNNVKQDEILNLYNPKKYIYEEPMMFFNKNKNKKKKDCNNNELNSIDIRKHYHYSRWYSCNKVIKLKQEYEKEHNFKYDFVMNTRFDIAFLTELKFNNFDNKYFYAGNWCQIYLPNDIFLENNCYYLIEKIMKNEASSEDIKRLPTKYKKHLNIIKNTNIKDLKHVHIGYPYEDTHGFIDQWFFSNSEYMDIFGNLYNNIDNYINICNEISSHRWIKIHLENENILDKVKNTFHLHDDFPLVRRKFLNNIK